MTSGGPKFAGFLSKVNGVALVIVSIPDNVLPVGIYHSLVIKDGHEVIKNARPASAGLMKL